MRHDPIEFGRRGLAARETAERVTRLASRLTRRGQAAPAPRTAEAIDEAFAGFQGNRARMTRVDHSSDSLTAGAGQSAEPPNAAAAWEPVKREIIADLSAQLELLDNQRERLTRLLRTVDADSRV